MKTYYYEALNRYIVDTKHSIERFNDQQRFQQSAGTEEFGMAIEKVIRAGMDKIMREYHDEQGSYLIHSNSTNINVVISWDYPPRDFPVKSNRNRNQANVISILPIKKDPFAKPGDVFLRVASAGGPYLIIAKEDGYVTDMPFIEVE